MDEFLKQHSGELTILLLCAMLCLTLLLLVPHLLRAHLKTMEYYGVFSGLCSW